MSEPGLRLRGARAAVLLVAGYLAVTGALAWGSAGALRAVHAPGPVQPGALVAAAAAAAAWSLLTWLTAVTLLMVGTAVLAGVGSRAHTRAAGLTPAVARSCAAALLGLSTLAAAAVTAGPAQAARVVAATAGHGSTPVPLSAARPTASPVGLDRPVAQAPAGWTPDRPAAPARRSARVGGSVRLVTAVPHAGRAVSDEVVVHRGDTLWAIAARHLGPGAGTAEVAEQWPRWYAANRAVIGDDPGLLVPGQRLRPPRGG